MKWCMYIVIVLAILVALYGCDESPVPAEAPPKVQQSDDASAAGLMLDTLWPSKEAAQSFLDMLKGAVAVVAEAEEMAAQTLAWAVGMGGNPAKIEYTSFLIRPKKPTDAEGLLPWVAEGHRLGQVPQFFASSNNVPKLVDIIRQSYPKEDIFADNLRNGLIQLDRVDQKTGRPIPPGTKDVYTSFIVRHRQPGDLGACPWVADGVSNTGTKRFYVSADTIQKVAERIRENFPDQSIFVDNGVNTNPVEIEMPGKEILSPTDDEPKPAEWVCYPASTYQKNLGASAWVLHEKDAEHMKYPGPWFITDRTSKDCCDRLRKLWPNTKVEVHIQ